MVKYAYTHSNTIMLMLIPNVEQSFGIDEKYRAHIKILYSRCSLVIVGIIILSVSAHIISMRCLWKGTKCKCVSNWANERASERKSERDENSAKPAGTLLDWMLSQNQTELYAAYWNSYRGIKCAFGTDGNGEEGACDKFSISMVNARDRMNARAWKGENVCGRKRGEQKAIQIETKTGREEKKKKQFSYSAVISNNKIQPTTSTT